MFLSRIFRPLFAVGLAPQRVSVLPDAPAGSSTAVPDDDPYLWLEEVESAAALTFVEQANARSLGELEALPGYRPLYERLLAMFDSKERIPDVEQLGEYLYNFWQDETHVRGVWRRTTWAEYRQAEPAWERVLDLDQLAEDENENWVWDGADALYPDYRRCLVSLSRGGGDAQVVREFDLVACRFVDDGFVLPEAKSSIDWIDADTVFVATDFGPGSLTRSGYPRIVKEWRRGTPLSEARTVYEGRKSDLSVEAYQSLRPGHERQFVHRQVSFRTSELFLREGDTLTKIDKPGDADADVVREQILIRLRTPWTAGGRTYPADALLAADFAAYQRGERSFEVLFEPGERVSLDTWTATRTRLYLSVLDNVKSRVYELERSNGRWQKRELPLPGIGSAGVWPVDSYESDDYFLWFDEFLTPSTLYLSAGGSSQLEPLKRMPAFFDAGGLGVRQYEATSPDGTRVPYFVVAREQLELNGRNPALLYGYGGFEVPLTAGYSGTVGAGWLEAGGVYVVANIRGGGEFGPEWHQAALRGNRQRAFDDFAAVAEDLIARRITSPRHLGIEGGSNGGLLVGAVALQRPELFKAVVCQVPLLDMKRFHTLLAGDSWIDEYGNPDDPEDWAFIGRYSPYQNVLRDRRYPRFLFITSTRDDRVHPGHARKMYARMRDYGHDVLYYENMEGGHAGAANNRQAAQMSALGYAFLLEALR